LTLPRSDPNGVNVRRRTAFGAQVLFVDRPEVIGDRHAVLIARPLQPHGDEAPLAIDILQCHAQNPVSASNRTPIADALTRARQQRQNRFIAIGTGAVDQLRGDRRTMTTKQVRETKAEAVAFVVCQSVGLKTGTASADYVTVKFM